MSAGYVYILSNPSMPGLIKIGRSQNDPQLRAQQLYTTGVPEPFKIEFVWYTDDCENLEQELHASFVQHRMAGREFFNIDPSEPIQELLEPFLAEFNLAIVSDQDASDLMFLSFICGNFPGTKNEEILSAVNHIPVDIVNSAIAEYRRQMLLMKKMQSENVVSFPYTERGF